MVRLILICISLFCNLSYGAIGKITEHEKEPASIVRNNDKLEGKKGTELEMNDAIHTGKSVVGITFDDETKVNITENSKLVIDDFVYEPKKGAGKLGMKVAMGTVRYASGIIAHKNPNAVDIKTPTSTIAVRGTDFLMSVDEIGRSMIILLPQCDALGVCITGIIDVITPAGMVTLDQPNQATMVDTGYDPPSPPVILNMEGRQLNNSLQISQPKTTSGGSVAQPKQEIKKESTEQQVAVVSQEEEKEEKKEEKVVVIVTEEEDDPVYTTSKSSKVFPMYEKQLIVSWMYKTTPNDNKGYMNIVVPKSSDVFLNVMQDFEMDSYVFGKGNGGIINIIQTNK
jgi:hypothetical protein